MWFGSPVFLRAKAFKTRRLGNDSQNSRHAYTKKVVLSKALIISTFNFKR